MRLLNGLNGRVPMVTAENTEQHGVKVMEGILGKYLAMFIQEMLQVLQGCEFGHFTLRKENTHTHTHTHTLFTHTQTQTPLIII